MFTRITDTEFRSLLYILKNLRPDDREELGATQGHKYEPRDFARKISGLEKGRGVSFIAWHDGLPACVWGAYVMTPACLSVWAFGTPDFKRVIRPVTRHIQKAMIPVLLKAGFHRAECRALATRYDTRRWLNFLGFRAEAVLSGFGVRREDFILFAWTVDDEAAHSRQSPQRSRVPLRLD